MESVGKPPFVTMNNSNNVHAAAAGATPFTTIAASSNGNLESECSAHHHEPYGHLSPPTRRTSNELLEDDTNEATTTTAAAAATTNGIQYEQRISLSPVPRGPPGLEDTTTTQHYYSSTIAATPQQQQQLTKKRKPTEQQNQKSKKYDMDDGEQFNVPSSIILTEFSGSSVDDELLESDSEESSVGRTHRLQQLSTQISKRNQEKMRCVVDVCRKLKVENRNLRGSVKKQHRELTGYRSMHSSLASIPADYTIPPLSARGERNGSTINNHSRTPSNIIEHMYPHSTPPICPKQEEYCGAPITLETHKKGAPEHKKCLASLVNTSFGTNHNNNNNTSDPTPTTTNANATPEQLLLEQINSIGVPDSSSSPEQCIELLRHLLLRTMIQCRAGEEVIQELERERRGTAITLMRMKKENAELAAARDEADGRVRALEGQQQQQQQNTAVDVEEDERDRFEESGSIANEVGGRGGGTAVTNGKNHQHNNNEERPPNHHHPEAQRQSSTMRRKGSSFHLSQRHVAGGHFSTDSSAPVSPAHHAHSNASGGYGLSSNGGAVGSGGRRTSSSALTGAGGAGGAASFVRSLSADRSVASSTKHGGAGGTADRPGTPASTSVGFRRSRPVPQHPARGGGSTQLDSSTLDDPNTSGDIHASSDHHQQLSASVKLHTAPAVPALRRIATSPTIQAKRSPRGAPSTPSTGVRNTTFTATNGGDTAVRSGVRTPISSRPPGHNSLQKGGGGLYPVVSSSAGGGGRTTSPTTRTPLVGSSTLRSASATKRTPLTTSLTTTPSQSLRPAARPTATAAMNGGSRTTSPATTTNGAHRSNITAVSGSGGIGSKSAAVGTPKAAGASSSKVVPAGSSRDKQRAMLSHSPTSKLRGVTPTTPSGRRPIGSNGDAIVSKVNSHRNSVGTSKVNTTTTSRATGADGSARKALASSPLR